MAASPESPTPQSQGSPYPPGESKLELMPTEILNQIFEQLSQNYLLSIHDLGQRDLLEAKRSAHSNMRSLCLTSKRVDVVARPLLFRTITISSSAMLVRLYDALLANTELGCHVKQISFEISRRRMGLWDFLPPRSPQSQRLLTDWDEEWNEEGNEDIGDLTKQAAFNIYCCDQIMSSCYFEILRRTSNVHRLVIRIQPTGRLSRENNESGLNSEMGIYMYQSFFRKVRDAVQASLRGDGPEFLPRLTTLQLLGDPIYHGNFFDITICEPLLRLHTLENITTFRDNGFWSALAPETSGSAQSAAPAFTNVRMAELQQSAIHSRDFRALGVLLQNVEVLKISNPRYAWERHSDIQRRARELQLDQRVDLLQEALVQMTNLQTLVLDFTYESIGRNGAPVATNLNLASLPKLETVNIPLQMLVYYCYRTGRKRNDGLVDAFPISLKRLTLRVDLACNNCIGYDDPPDLLDRSWPEFSTLLDFIEALSHLGRDAFPQLEKIVCCYNEKVADASDSHEGEDVEAIKFFGLEGDDLQRLEQLRISLRQQQIGLGAAYKRLECSECAW